MKTLKKIVSLSLVMTMIITTLLTNCAFAAITFNDVNETTAYSEAIYNLVESGVLNGYDSTTEGALAKLFYLLGQFDDNKMVKKSIEDNLRGEISK